MKIRQIYLIVLICEIANHINGQDDCALNSIKFINIASNATLWWEINPISSCEVISFNVEVVGEHEGQYYFNVSNNFVNLSFLEVCDKYYFTVTPISNGVTGIRRTLGTHIPLPPDADLQVGTFKYLFHGTNVTLEWSLRNKTFGDCNIEYRLALQDLDRGTIEDVYVEGKSAHLNTLSPCIDYEISIRAINQAHPIIEGPIRRLNLRLYDRPQVGPTIKTVKLKATSINMTWALQGDSNRCPLKSFYIEGGLYFNESYSLHDLLDPTLAFVDIKGLRPNSMYYMKVYVENSGGRSPPTPIAIQTLPLS